MQQIPMNTFKFKSLAKLIITALILIGLMIFRHWTTSFVKMEFRIKTTWDNRNIQHEPVFIRLERLNEFIRMTVEAPFFNNPGPPPGGVSGQPFDKLWDYEVVEAFFLGKDDRYLEVELCPHGQHLVLFLNGARTMIKSMLPLKFTAEVKQKRWFGSADIPIEYFPLAVNKFNAYAISGSGSSRSYEALYPAPQNEFKEPDFHRLQFLKPIDFESLVPGNGKSEPSSAWKKALSEKS